MDKLSLIESNATKLLEEMEQTEIPVDLKSEANELLLEIQTSIESKSKWLRILNYYNAYTQICAKFHQLVKSTLDQVNPEVLSNLSAENRIETLKVLKNK